MNDLFNDFLKKMKKTIEEAIAKGRKEARDETKLNTARKMLALKKYSLEDIALITGFTIEKVTQLAVQSNPA